MTETILNNEVAKIPKPKLAKLKESKQIELNNSNSNKFKEIVGKIVDKQLKKVYDKDSEFYGNLFYKAKIVEENTHKETFLFIYPNLVSTQIFKTIEQSKYIDRRYLFFCEKRQRGYALHNWRELNSHE